MIQQFCFRKVSGQRRLPLCPAPRRVYFARPGLKHPSLHSLTLVWQRRDVPRRFTWHFLQASVRAQHDSCCSVCTTVDARWVRCFSCFLRPSPCRPTASCSLAAERLGDCVRKSWLYCIRSPTHRSLLVLLCVPLPDALARPALLR